MTTRGRVTNGAIVLENGCPVPENTPVVIWAEEPADGKMPEGARTELLRAEEEIQALPPEDDDDGFSGADHDKVLYGSAT